MIVTMIVVFTTQSRHENAHRNQWNYVIGSSPTREAAIFASTCMCKVHMYVQVYLITIIYMHVGSLTR